MTTIVRGINMQKSSRREREREMIGRNVAEAKPKNAWAGIFFCGNLRERKMVPFTANLNSLALFPSAFALGDFLH